METRRLKAFLEIVDQRSITRAAEALSIAQPALSLQVQALEQAFGAQLLIRSHQGIKLTDAGRALYLHAKIILKQYADARREVMAATQELTGVVRIGLPGSLNLTIGRRLTQVTAERYPGIVLVLSEGLAGGLLNELTMRQKFDLVLLSAEVTNRSLMCTPLVAEELVLVGEYSQAPDSSAPVTMAEVAMLPLVLPAGSNQLRQVIQQRIDRERLSPKLIAEVDSIYLLREAASKGVGWTILPLAVAKNSQGQALSIRHIIDPPLERTITLATVQPEPVGTEVAAVRGVITELAAALAASGEWPGARALGEGA
jgi:LysR family nitrogen assimilation transcriptional regulator